MDLLAGAAFAWCAVYVLLAIYFGILGARTTGRATDDAAFAVERREYLLFAGACACGAGYAFCNAMHVHSLEPEVAARWGWRALFFAPLIPPLAIGVVAEYAEIDPPTRRLYVVSSSIVAALCVLTNALGGLRAIGALQERELSLGAIVYRDHSWALRPGMKVFHLYMLIASFVAMGILVRCYLSGKREALLACMGGLVITVCTVNDVLVMDDVYRGVYLAEHGFSAFAFGLSYTLLARHARVSEELSIKGGELRRRARQLRRSYDELRAAQEDMVRREQLAVVGEIAAVVSHEVRNPLAIIGNAVAGLRRPETSEADKALLLSILDEETERLNRLVGDLLRYARPFAIERRLLDLDALISRALELARNHPNVKLDVELAPAHGPLPETYGDPDLLRQVLDNLVQNACQAMSEGGTLTVRLEAGEDDGVAGSMVHVSDTGEGMDTQVRSRARTPFFTTRPGGTGLGLAICDRIVTAHGGFLSIKSRAGEGTIVTVFLPSGPRSDVPSVVKPSSNPPFGSRGAVLTPIFGVPSGSRRTKKEG